MIPRSWYRAQKPLKPGNTKKVTKSPTPGRAPKIRKKYRKKYENGPKMTVFVFFLYLFRIFGARPGVGDFVIFFVFFSYFQAGGVFELYTRNAESQGHTGDSLIGHDLFSKWTFLWNSLPKPSFTECLALIQ